MAKWFFNHCTLGNAGMLFLYIKQQTYNMATWFYAHISDVTAPQVLLPLFCYEVWSGNALRYVQLWYGPDIAR